MTESRAEATSDILILHGDDALAVLELKRQGGCRLPTNSSRSPTPEYSIQDHLWSFSNILDVNATFTQPS